MLEKFMSRTIMRHYGFLNLRLFFILFFNRNWLMSLPRIYQGRVVRHKEII